MSKNKGKILILEDDESLGAALDAALTRDGFQCFAVARPGEADAIIADHRDLDFIICDCLLPQMTGLDFIARAKNKFITLNAKYILMSGIYIDNQFIQDALKSTQAVSFLKKPFAVNELLKVLHKGSPEISETGQKKDLYQIFSNPSATNRHRRRVIDSIDEMSGFDLPFLYSLLIETKSDGYLTIYSDDGSVSGVSFCRGNIVGVDIDDKKTVLGEMLIQSGYCMPADVQWALRDKNTRRIGTYLIENNKLSPHAFELILTEQMNIRLSRTITENKIRVSFSAAEVDMTSPYIDSGNFAHYLHDWIVSKISINWLKSLYVMWSGNAITKSGTFHSDHPALSMPIVKSLDGFLNYLDKKITLAQILDMNGYSEVAVYKAIHFLLTKGLVIFEKRGKFENTEEQLQVLSWILSEIEGKNKYQVIQYMQSAAGSDAVETAYSQFLNTIGPRPQESSKESLEMWDKVKKMAEEALLAARDPNKVSEYLEESQKNQAEGKLRAASLMEEIKKALQLNQYSKALNDLTEVAKLNPEIQHFHLYNSWAKLGAVDNAKKQTIIKEVELELTQVPPDERYDAVYPFVMGLLFKNKGDLVGARKSFDKSVALDYSFIPARREISMLFSQNKKQDVFSMDLTQVVSGFFKKRS